MKQNKLHILIDTREQLPFSFRGRECKLSFTTLPSGDYSLAHLKNLVCVERKSLADLMHCLGAERPRFFRELERLRGYEAAALVIESPLEDIQAGRYRSRITPQSVIQSIISIQVSYRLPICFARDRQAAEDFTFDFLRHYSSTIKRRYKGAITTDDEEPAPDEQG